MTTHHLFETLIALHIIGGVPGLISFWAPIATKKGGQRHRFWGGVFTASMLFTGAMAIGMSSLTLLAPIATHPKLVSHPEFSDPALIRGIFGWMMLYLAILTINLAWYGWRATRNKANHSLNRGPFNMALQAILGVAALNCAIQGILIGQPMMIGISFVGFATVGTNLWFILRDAPRPYEWLLEHIKGIVGAGISVYTAFFAFGAVRLVPELALAPALWAAPLITGLAIIIGYQRSVRRRFSARPRSSLPGAPQNA
ncbi:MAG: hypothetical protein AAFW81_10645 [Pseudomonadota bacterium]